MALPLAAMAVMTLAPAVLGIGQQLIANNQAEKAREANEKLAKELAEKQERQTRELMLAAQGGTQNATNIYATQGPGGMVPGGEFPPGMGYPQA